MKKLIQVTNAVLMAADLPTGNSVNLTKLFRRRDAASHGGGEGTGNVSFKNSCLSLDNTISTGFAHDLANFKSPQMKLTERVT